MFDLPSLLLAPVHGLLEHGFVRVLFEGYLSITGSCIRILSVRKCLRAEREGQEKCGLEGGGVRLGACVTYVEYRHFGSSGLARKARM